MNVPTKLGFVFEDTVYVSDSFTLLKEKCIELGAHRIDGPGTGINLKKIILPVTPELLTAFLFDFNEVELSEPETFGQPIETGMEQSYPVEGDDPFEDAGLFELAEEAEELWIGATEGDVVTNIESDEDSYGTTEAFEPESFNFFVNLDQNTRLESLMTRIAATVFAGHKVELLPASSPRLRHNSLYVIVKAVA